MNWPSYFNPKINPDNTVTLYHGLNDEALDYVLTYQRYDPKVCSEGAYGIWFSTGKGDKSYSSGYQNLTSIRVPVQEIGTKFRIMNSMDLKTEKPVSLYDYGFKLLKVHGVILTDPETLKILDQARNELETWSPYDKYDSIYYAVLDIIDLYVR